MSDSRPYEKDITVHDLLLLYAEQADKIHSLSAALSIERKRLASCEQLNSVLQKKSGQIHGNTLISTTSDGSDYVAALARAKEPFEERLDAAIAAAAMERKLLQGRLRVTAASAMTERELMQRKLRVMTASATAERELLQAELRSATARAAEECDRLLLEIEMGSRLRDSLSAEVSVGKKYEMALIASLAAVNDELIEARDIIATLGIEHARKANSR